MLSRFHLIPDIARQYAERDKKKLVLEQPAHVWQWSLSKRVVATVCPLHFDIKI